MPYIFGANKLYSEFNRNDFFSSERKFLATSNFMLFSVCSAVCSVQRPLLIILYVRDVDNIDRFPSSF